MISWWSVALVWGLLNILGWKSCISEEERKDFYIGASVATFASFVLLWLMN